MTLTMPPTAAKPKGRGNPTIHYYRPDDDVAGLFVPICNERGHAYKAWHLRFAPDDSVDDGGWSDGRICPDCRGMIARATHH